MVAFFLAAKIWISFFPEKAWGYDPVVASCPGCMYGLFSGLLI